MQTTNKADSKKTGGLIQYDLYEPNTGRGYQTHVPLIRAKQEGSSEKWD